MRGSQSEGAACGSRRMIPMRTLLAASIVVLGAAACSREKTPSPQSSSASAQRRSGPATAQAAAAALQRLAASVADGPPLSSLDGFQGEIDLRREGERPERRRDAVRHSRQGQQGPLRSCPTPSPRRPTAWSARSPTPSSTRPRRSSSVVSDEAQTSPPRRHERQVGRVSRAWPAPPSRAPPPRGCRRTPAHVTQTGRFDTSWRARNAKSGTSRPTTASRRCAWPSRTYRSCMSPLPA